MYQNFSSKQESYVCVCEILANHYVCVCCIH